MCAAGEAHFGPFDTMPEDELALGIESKLLGQIRLVLLGRALRPSLMMKPCAVGSDAEP